MKNHQNYQLTFDNKEVIDIKMDLSNPKSFMNLQAFCVHHIEKNNLSSCLILTPSNVWRRVRKTGKFHWNHDGYEFD